MRLGRSFLSLVVCAIPTLAAADPITISLSRTAFVGVDAIVHGGDFEPHAFDNDRDELAASLTFSRGAVGGTGSAALSSRLSADGRHLSGNGHGNWSGESDGGFDNGAFVEVDADLFWRFRIDRPFLFDFDGTLAAAGPGQAPSGGGWSTSLGSTSRGIFDHLSSQRASDAFAVNGKLDPGDYTFQVAGGTSGTVLQGTGTGSFNMDFTFDLIPATPEPGTIVLFATGLFGLAGAIRRAAS